MSASASEPTLIDVRRLARRLKARVENRALILMYHRIADVASDPWGLAVTPEHFAEQLAVLRRRYSPISLGELVQALECGRLPRRAVVVTFDDGYADNLHIAKPLLEKLDIPATVFIATGHIGRTWPFWWDDMDRAILQPHRLPNHLKIEIGPTTHEWDLGDAVQQRADDRTSGRSWRAWHTAPPGSRQALFLTLYGLLDAATADERDAAVWQLKEWAGIAAASDDYGVVNAEEVVRLGEGGRIDIGAHTISHARLARLPLEEQRKEIRGSRAALEGMLARTVTSFAYPHGMRTDYTPESVTAVREAGFTCACAAYAGDVTMVLDQFQLPRHGVPDLDANAFEAWLW